MMCDTPRAKTSIMEIIPRTMINDVPWREMRNLEDFCCMLRGCELLRIILDQLEKGYFFRYNII